MKSIFNFELPPEVAQSIAFGLSGIILGFIFGYWLAGRYAARKAARIARWEKRIRDLSQG